MGTSAREQGHCSTKVHLLPRPVTSRLPAVGSTVLQTEKPTASGWGRSKSSSPETKITFHASLPRGARWEKWRDRRKSPEHAEQARQFLHMKSRLTIRPICSSKPGDTSWDFPFQNLELSLRVSDLNNKLNVLDNLLSGPNLGLTCNHWTETVAWETFGAFQISCCHFLLYQVSTSCVLLQPLGRKIWKQ